MLSEITAPVYLHYSDNDWLASPKDVDELSSKLGNLSGMYRIVDDDFNHLDFQWAIDSKSLVYDIVLSILERN